MVPLDVAQTPADYVGPLVPWIGLILLLLVVWAIVRAARKR